MTEIYRVPLRFRLSRVLLRASCRFIFHVLGRVSVTGKENVPFGKPYVVAINHISLFDPPLAAAFWPEVLEIVGASDILNRTGQGQLFRWYGAIPVHRGEYDRVVLQRTLSVINAGYPLLIAPEGGRSHNPALRRAYPGIAYIIEATRVPVMPVALVGTTEDFWQRAKQGERPRLEMRIGAPVYLPTIKERGTLRREARQRNADLVMRHLAGLLPEEYRGVYAQTVIRPAETGQ